MTPSRLGSGDDHHAGEIDADYAVYDELPLDEPDEWGDLASFRQAAAAYREPELRSNFRTPRQGEESMAGYVQIIEIQTSRIDEVDALIDERRSEGPIPMRRATMTADRDRPGYYLSILEFDSYEEAMANSNRPETAEMARQMASLCDGPPKFYNLDIRRSEQR